MPDQLAKLLWSSFERPYGRQRKRRLGRFEPEEQRRAANHIATAGDPDRAGVSRDEGFTLGDKPKPRRGLALDCHTSAAFNEALAQAGGGELEVGPRQAGEQLDGTEPVCPHAPRL